MTDWPDDVSEYVPLRGWMKRGPDRNQGFSGWTVYASPPDENAVPVTIIPDDEEGPPCICDGDNVALQVLCRAFDDDPSDSIEAWRAFDKSGWFWWGRALGAFIRRKINSGGNDE